MTTIEHMARWARELTFDQVPAEVLELCRAQRRSVLAAIAASLGDEASERVLDSLDASATDGPAPLLGRRRRVRVEDALIGASALSIALDFDDYLCFGHTGHSSVLVPMLLATETGASGRDQLLAQVIANELEARLGAACLLGPLNGQLWAFIHALGAAAVAGLSFGLDEERLAHAMAIALYQVPRPTAPGFMAPDSKLLTASDPTLTGLRAARMAAHGVTGPLDVLDHESGFLSAFAFAPLRVMLGGLGRGWATRTLSIKPYPGCAYLDTTVDAIRMLPNLRPEDIESVDIDAGILTCGMDAMNSEYATAATPTAVTVCFSIPWNAAIVLSENRLTDAEVNSAWLRDNAPRLRSLADRVRLHHQWSQTQKTLECVVPILSPRAVVKPLGARRLVSALVEMRRHHQGVQLRPSDGVSFLRYVMTSGEESSGEAAFRAWDDESLKRFRMTFPARVRVTQTDGSVHEASVDVPRGGAGNTDVSPRDAAREKWDTLAERLFGEHTVRIDRAIERDADHILERATS